VSDLMAGPSDEDVQSRRRALWALLVLVLVAVFIGAIMVFVIGSSGGGTHHGLGGSDDTTEPTQSSSRPPTSSAARTGRTTPTRPPSTSARPKATSTANPCPSTAPCAVADDVGSAVQALNDFRVRHGRPAVPGSASAKAAQCALSQGDGASCRPHYSWQPGAATADGAKVISAIAGRSDGMQWLLDPEMSSFTVGWAYSPGAGGAGHYECAILKTG
jgi:hypothetical protein